MITFKTIDITAVFQLQSLLAWVVVGLVAGFLAGLVVRGRGFGCLGNIVVGLLGSVIGAVLATTFNWGRGFEFWGSLLISFIGAVILVFVLQLFTGRR